MGRNSVARRVADRIGLTRYAWISLLGLPCLLQGVGKVSAALTWISLSWPNQDMSLADRTPAEQHFYLMCPSPHHWVAIAAAPAAAPIGTVWRKSSWVVKSGHALGGHGTMTLETSANITTSYNFFWVLMIYLLMKSLCVRQVRERRLSTR